LLAPGFLLNFSLSFFLKGLSVEGGLSDVVESEPNFRSNFSNRLVKASWRA
jgi:hypothetical protein